MSSQQATFDPAQVPRPDNLGQRRGYIEKYIQHFHKELLPKMASAREGAIFFVSRQYHEGRGQIEAPLVYFEYMVDKTLWRNIFLGLGKDAPAWPWKKGPSLDDMSGGKSRRYREWRIKYGLPTTPQQEADTSSGKGEGKATEKTPEITKPAATTTQASNGESSKTQESRGESSKAWVTINRHRAKVPHRLQGGAPVPQAAPKELPQGLKTLFRDLHSALPENELLLPPRVTPETTSPVPPQVPSQLALPVEPKVTSPVPTEVLPKVALPVEPETEPSIAQQRIGNPVVLNKATREWFWEICSGGPCIGVLADPFTLNLPVWLDFERLVVGEDGRDIDAINNEILEPGVAISWEVYGGKPLCLVVGFTDKANSLLPQVQQHMFDVWCDVVTWFCSAVSGSPVSLAPYLRAIQVVSPCLERTPEVRQVQAVWQEAVAERGLFAARARQALECFDLWSPTIRETIQQPLGIAEESLNAWIWGGRDSDESTKRLNVAREVWLSSSSDPKVIRRASKWVQSFVATLQPSA
ncbi:hypothetical protein FPCIR_12917 [Fusarium pseudocircinatum]|uniref:Uncharacterized protein n=1 Tax=Fusarium pseudocircinatum TaxID=56676 RepID=A0A8H5KP28_9HYPO|nr:hypothetical protein FPCIR_12917 [Fusarium pseudocircinatum]